MTDEKPNFRDVRIWEDWPEGVTVEVTYEASFSDSKMTTPRYIHERKPKLRWWRRMLGRWGR